MICCAEQNNQIKSAEGTSGKEIQPSPFCATTSVGFFIGDIGKFITIYMHRIILGASVGIQTDHLDGKGFNNSRKNIKACSHAQNQWNRG